MNITTFTENIFENLMKIEDHALNKKIIFLRKKLDNASEIEHACELALESLIKTLSQKKYSQHHSLKNEIYFFLEQRKVISSEHDNQLPLNPADTKPYHIKQKTVSLSILSTAGKSMQKKYTLEWAQRNLPAWAELVYTIQTQKRKPFFFGRTQGQRLNRNAYHYYLSLNKKKQSMTEEGLIKAVNTRGVEKADWNDVANYWLKSLAKYRNSILKKTPEILETINTEQKQFWNDFDLTQQKLGKNWQIDVGRFDYQHKPIFHFGSQKIISATKRNIDHDRDLINRRACKFLLHQMRRHDRLILWSLDGIDIEAVATGAMFIITENAKQKTKVPVCTSELRELFRLWDYFQSHVLFTENLAVVCAPWEHALSQMDWAHYALHLARKILILCSPEPAFLENTYEMLSAFLESDHSKVITLYHQAKPSNYLHNSPVALSSQFFKQTKQRNKEGQNYPEDFKMQKQICIDKIAQTLCSQADIIAAKQENLEENSYFSNLTLS